MSRIKDSIKVLIGRSKATPINHEKRFFCPVCENKIAKFEELPEYYYLNQDKVQFIHSIFQMETINRLSYSCPNCEASDRERLYAMYFNLQEINKNKKIKNFKFLDFAPSKSLQKFIKNNIKNIDYRSADKTMKDVDYNVDITEMSIFEDNTFDFLLCSHVLEHVVEDRKALGELYRILKPGGKCILMVPILLSLSEDYENNSLKTEEERWKHFGQFDHVRMYSKPGFISKINHAGFKLEEFTAEQFKKSDFEKQGIHMRSVLYIATK
jgi:predicted SAM-dependent methyltransferase